MYQIVVSDSKVLDLAGQASFEEINAQVEPTDAKAPEALIEDAAGADALIIDAKTRVTAAVFEALDSLSVVGRAGTGVDSIDLQAAEQHGVTVVNVPDYATDEVATHAMALMLACSRRVAAYDRSLRAGEWDWTLGRPIECLAGGTVGVVGFGAIGRRFVRKLGGFDVDVCSFDPYVDETEMAEYGVLKVSFDRLLRGADIVSIHAPLTKETRGLFDTDAFELMGDRAILINTARGPIVDETALENALRSDRLGAAGLDVRATEPPTSSSLTDLSTVVSTPHAGWYSEQSRETLNQTIADDVARVLEGENPANPVNTGSWS